MAKTNSKLKSRIKSVIILFLGIVIGATGYYFYDIKGVILEKHFPNKDVIARKQLKNYMRYLESSLDTLHQIKSNPVPGDWLYGHEEKGQSMEEYVKAKPVGKTPERYKVYIQTLGEFNKTEKAILIITADYLQKFYNIPVEILDPIPVSIVPADQQRDHQGYHQINARYVLNKVLKPKLPDDAAAYMAFTNMDLYPSDDYNFVFGLGSLKNRVGVYSIARFGDPNFSKKAYHQCLSRTLKVAAHELGHMFTIKHCIQYECVMNGSNHLEESDFKPQYLCPKDLFKVCWNLETDENYRFNKLANFWEQLGFEDNAKFYKVSMLLLKNEQLEKNAKFQETLDN